MKLCYRLVFLTVILISLLLIPCSSWSYTYQDVQNFVDNNPAPEGCFNWTEEYTNANGESGIYVWRRCGGGISVVGNPKFQDYAIVYGSGPHPPAHWFASGLKITVSKSA